MILLKYSYNHWSRFGSQVVQQLALSPHSMRVLGFNLPAGLQPFHTAFACSPSACMSFLWALQFPP